MNIELILWIVAFFIIWEISYLIRLKYFDDEYDTWKTHKRYSFLFTILFFTIQIGILTTWSTDILPPFHYERLIYEMGVLFFLFLFFRLNKWIANKK